VSLTDSENSFQPDNKSTDTLLYTNKEAPSTTTPGYEIVREREREREQLDIPLARTSPWLRTAPIIALFPEKNTSNFLRYKR
jgi:hypothetical protein